jgi:hypothetical protein
MLFDQHKGQNRHKNAAQGKKIGDNRCIGQFESLKIRKKVENLKGPRNDEPPPSGHGRQGRAINGDERNEEKGN